MSERASLRGRRRGRHGFPAARAVPDVRVIAARGLAVVPVAGLQRLVAALDVLRGTGWGGDDDRRVVHRRRVIRLVGAPPIAWPPVAWTPIGAESEPDRYPRATMAPVLDQGLAGAKDTSRGKQAADQQSQRS